MNLPVPIFGVHLYSVATDACVGVQQQFSTVLTYVKQTILEYVSASDN